MHVNRTRLALFVFSFGLSVGLGGCASLRASDAQKKSQRFSDLYNSDASAAPKSDSARIAQGLNPVPRGPGNWFDKLGLGRKKKSQVATQEVEAEMGYLYPPDSKQAKRVKIKVRRGAQASINLGAVGEVKQAYTGKNKAPQQQLTDSSLFNVLTGKYGTSQLQVKSSGTQIATPQPAAKASASFFGGLIVRLKAWGQYALAIVGGLLILGLFLFFLFFRRKKQAIVSHLEDLL